MTPARVGIVDDRRLIADALAALVSGLEGFVASWSGPPSDLDGLLGTADPDLVLVGIGSDREGALSLIPCLRELRPQLPTVLVTDQRDPALIRFVLEHSVNGLLLTDEPAGDMAVSLEYVLRGHSVLPVGWQSDLTTARADPIGQLSVRQLEVLRLIAQGCSIQQIADRLFISPNTVKFHVRSIYLTLGVSNRVAAARTLARYRPGQVDINRPKGWSAHHPSGR